AFAALDRIIERQVGVAGRVVDDDACILVTADGAAGDFDRECKAVAAVTRDGDEDRRVAAEAGEVRPRHVDRTVVRDGDGLVIRELAVRSARLAVALKRADERERMVGAAGGPTAAAIARPAEPKGYCFPAITEAREVGRSSIGAKGDARITAEVVGARSRNRGVVRELRDPGDEAVGQRRRPRLATVEGRVDAAAVVVVPVVVAGDHVARVCRIDRERSLVLGGGVAADVDDRRRAGAEGAEGRGAEGGDGGFAASGEQQACAEGGVESGSHAGSPSAAGRLEGWRRL